MNLDFSCFSRDDAFSYFQNNTLIFSVMHRDEILGKPGTLVLRASLDKPTQLNYVITRLAKGDLFRLEVVPETTIRECRTQMESVSGHLHDGYLWLFDGRLLETGRKIGYYGIDNRSPIDVVLRRLFGFIYMPFVCMLQTLLLWCKVKPFFLLCSWIYANQYHFGNSPINIIMYVFCCSNYTQKSKICLKHYP